MAKRLSGMGIDTANEVSVCQYDLEGNFIKEYPTITEASYTTNTPIYHIREEGVYNNSLWMRKDNSKEPKQYLQELSRMTRGLSGIKQYNEFGEFIAEFSNAADASRKTGIDVSSIKAASEGRQASAGGYIWIRIHNGLSLEAALEKYLLSSTCCKIEEIDDNGNIINTFDSCNKAEKYYGWGSNSIKPVCDGKRKITHGKRFRWQNPLKRKLIEERNEKNG